VEKVFYKKRDDLEEKVKHLEGDVFVVHQPTDNFIFQVITYHALLSHSMQNEWMVDFGCTHHMAKDASLFTWLDEAKERKIFVVDDFSLDVSRQGDVSCRHRKIFDVYHVPNIISNLFFVDQLTQTSNIVEFLLDLFYVFYLKGNSIVTGELLNPIENFYKLYNMTQPKLEPTSLVSHTDERS
jgi:hypothetical protein